jgi:hypothetical protein
MKIAEQQKQRQRLRSEVARLSEPECAEVLEYIEIMRALAGHGERAARRVTAPADATKDRRAASALGLRPA